MSTFVNSDQAANITRLQVAARSLEKHREGTDKHAVARTQYNQAFNRLHDQGMRSSEILLHVGVDCSNINGGGMNDEPCNRTS